MKKNPMALFGLFFLCFMLLKVSSTKEVGQFQGKIYYSVVTMLIL